MYNFLYSIYPWQKKIASPHHIPIKRRHSNSEARRRVALLNGFITGFGRSDISKTRIQILPQNCMVLT